MQRTKSGVILGGNLSCFICGKLAPWFKHWGWDFGFCLLPYWNWGMGCKCASLLNIHFSSNLFVIFELPIMLLLICFWSDVVLYIYILVIKDWLPTMSGVNPLNPRVRAFLARGCTPCNSIKLSTQRLAYQTFNSKIAWLPIHGGWDFYLDKP